MELLSTELKRYKSLSEDGSKKCELIQTEVNLLNKLLSFEQKFSDHLIKEVFVLYEKSFQNNQKNNKLFDGFNQLEKQKAIVKENEIQLKKLRQELKCWRQNNNRLTEDVCKSDHSYSTGTDSMTVVKEKLPTLKDIKKLYSQQTVCSNTPSTSFSEETITAELDTTEGSVSVNFEIIPKTEAIAPEVMNSANATEDTDTAPESEEFLIEDVEPLPSSSNTSKPFLFVSEYLSKTQAFGHLIDKSNEQTLQTIEDKSVDIDLNRDSDHEERTVVPIEAPNSSAKDRQSFFKDTIVDLTPINKNPKKSSAKKKTFIKKKKKPVKKKRVLRKVPKRVANQTRSVETVPTEPSATPSTSTSNERIVSSNRKKIHFNADNTISITEMTESPNKKLKTKKSTESKIIVIPLPAEDDKRKPNQYVVNSNKNVVLKGNLYYCRWKGCSYRSPIGSNVVRHTWSHTGEKPFKCRLCPQGFRDKRHLNTHLMAHNASKINETDSQLPSCSYRVRGSGDVVCPECDKKYQTFMLLSRHLKKAHGLKKAQKYRQEYYKQRDLLRNNQISPELNGRKDINDKRRSDTPQRTSKSALKSAQKTISVNKSVEINENKNQINIINNNKEWKCDFQSCSRSYHVKHHLKRHQMEIHKKISKPLFHSTLHSSDKKYKFFIPKKTESTDTLLQIGDNSTNIVEQITLNNKIFVCNYKNCQNSYATINGLYKHKKNVHKSKINMNSMEKKFEKSLKGQHNSKPIRAYVCPQSGCTSSFQWIKNLKTHLKVKHNISNADIPTKPEETVENTNSCELQCTYNDCIFTASSQKSLLIHFKTHFTPEDKPYKCLITDCNYSSKMLCQLKNHILNRHSEQQFHKAMREKGANYPYF